MPRKAAVPMFGLVTAVVAGGECAMAFVSPQSTSLTTRNNSAPAQKRLHVFDARAVATGTQSSKVPRRRTSTSLLLPTTPTLTRLYMDLDPLATEGDWSAYLDDETTGLVYYFNGKTGESVWEPPTDSFPTVRMNRKQEREMKEKRAEYEASLAQQEEEDAAAASDGSISTSKGNAGGFFASLLGGSDKVEETSDEETAAVVDEAENIAEEVMTAPKGFGAFFAGPARKEATSSSSAGIIEESVSDERAYAGSYQSQGERETKQKTSSKKKENTPVAVVEEGSAAIPVPSPAKKNFGLPNIFQKSKDENIIIPSESPIKIEVASKVLPSPEKASWGGEDAVFTKGRNFGVFDGVSGADKKKGVALYSFTLASQVKSLIGDDGLTISEMTDALATAADIANMEATGASTATLASIGEDDILRVLNVGDCSVLVYRDGKVLAKTKAIQHYFDCPYQLAEDSPDRARDGTKLTCAVQTGDIIVAGSDGIFDNLTDAQVWEEISSVPQRAGMIAGKIISQSRAVSLDKEAPTPYARQAQKNRYDAYKAGLGGKVDDISCVVIRCL